MSMIACSVLGRQLLQSSHGPRPHHPYGVRGAASAFANFVEREVVVPHLEQRAMVRRQMRDEFAEDCSLLLLLGFIDGRRGNTSDPDWSAVAQRDFAADGSLGAIAILTAEIRQVVEQKPPQPSLDFCLRSSTESPEVALRLEQCFLHQIGGPSLGAQSEIHFTLRYSQ